MLDNIKSSYILMMPFSLLHSHTKFKMVKYNKGLQKKLEMNIINYIEYSKTYIIYETNGKGKEYDKYTNKFIYEGEFLNGERTGKGKEYYLNIPAQYEDENIYIENMKNDRKLKFEGEYLQGKKWNGKGYNKNGNILYELKDGNGYIREYFEYEYELLKFECQIRNGELNGKGKENSIFCQPIFEGDYLNGNKWNGIGYNINSNKKYELKEGKGYFHEYYSNGNLKFEGNYLNGQRNGKGKEYYKNGRVKFYGEYIDGRRHGSGIKYHYNGDLMFKGEYEYNNRKKGTEYLNGRVEYEGEYRFEKKWNGKGYDRYGRIMYELKNGEGTVKEYDNYTGFLIFNGEYLNGKKSGKGKEYKNTHLIFKGEYLDGKRNGKGCEFEKSYLKFIGEYVDGVRNGKGKEFYTIYKVNSPESLSILDENDEGIIGIKFDGEFLNGDKWKGKLYYPNGNLEFEGEFSHGKKSKGNGYDNKGKLVFEGKYLNGKMWTGKRKEYYYHKNELKFDGEIKKGIRWNGKGKEYEQGYLTFDGEYLDGEKIGNKCVEEKI